jgi:hypothetical protein
MTFHLRPQLTTGNARAVKPPRPRRALGRATYLRQSDANADGNAHGYRRVLAANWVFELSDCTRSARQRLAANSGPRPLKPPRKLGGSRYQDRLGGRTRLVLCMERLSRMMWISFLAGCSATTAPTKRSARPAPASGTTTLSVAAGFCLGRESRTNRRVCPFSSPSSPPA